RSTVYAPSTSTVTYTRSLHDALPISVLGKAKLTLRPYFYPQNILVLDAKDFETGAIYLVRGEDRSKLGYRYDEKQLTIHLPETLDRKSTRLNSSHVKISYAVFCLKKK